MESNGTFGAPWQNEHVTPRPLATVKRMNFTTESRVRSAESTFRFFGFAASCDCAGLANVCAKIMSAESARAWRVK